MIEPVIEKSSQIHAGLSFHMCNVIGAFGVSEIEVCIVEIIAVALKEIVIANYPTQHMQHISCFVIAEPAIEYAADIRCVIHKNRTAGIGCYMINRIVFPDNPIIIRACPFIIQRCKICCEALVEPDVVPRRRR